LNFPSDYFFLSLFSKNPKHLYAGISFLDMNYKLMKQVDYSLMLLTILHD